MENSDKIFCKIVSQEISGLFCNINGAAGDCQNCHWDGVLKKLPTVADPPLRNFFKPSLIKRLGQAGVIDLGQIMALGEEGLSGRFERATIVKIRRLLEQASIDLPKLKSGNTELLPRRKPLPPSETPLTDLLPAKHLGSLRKWNITTLGNLLQLWSDLSRLVGGIIKGRIKRYLEARYEIKLN